MMKTKWLVFSIFLMLQAGIVQATCLPVAGLTFEKIDSNKLLVIRGGKNIVEAEKILQFYTHTIIYQNQSRSLDFLLKKFVILVLKINSI